MTAFSMYQAAVPVFIRGMTNLAAILKKAEDDAVARKIDPAVPMGSRLAPDMLPLPKQVQIASDTVKNGAARLAGVDAPSMADTETTFGELQARSAKTIAFLQTIEPAQLEGSEAREIVVKFPGRELRFSGAGYLTQFVLPNMYFHVTTAYAILRHNGVLLGKWDYLGSL